MARGEILTDREREYLKGRGAWPILRRRGPDQERSRPDRELKYRIDREAGRQLREIVRGFRLDLEAVDEYYKSERPEGWYEYTSITLPHTKDELKELRDDVDRLIQRAEGDTLQDEKKQVREPLSELAGGLPYVRAVESNEWESMNEVGIEWEGNEIVGPPEFLEEDEEFRERQRALMAVLGDRGLFEIFEWVSENEGDVNAEYMLKDREKSNSEESWKQAIGRYLISEHGLVAEQRWEYELTDRGKCVNRTIERLLESDAVKKRAGRAPNGEEADSGLDALGAALGDGREIDKRQAAVELLGQHFSANQWI